MVLLLMCLQQHQRQHQQQFQSADPLRPGIPFEFQLSWLREGVEKGLSAGRIRTNVGRLAARRIQLNMVIN